MPHDITTDPKNFQPYRFKVGAFFLRHGVYFTPVHTPVYSTHLSQSFHVHTPVYSTHLSESFHVHTPVHTPVYSTHLSESFHVHLGTTQLLPRMMSVTATLCHATKLARQVKHVDDQRTPTDLVLRYLTTQQHQNCSSRVELCWQVTVKSNILSIIFLPSHFNPSITRQQRL